MPAALTFFGEVRWPVNKRNGARQRCKQISGVLVLLALASCAPPSEEDRRALVGKWTPEDGSGHLVAFKADGVFDFLYDPATVLELSWELRSKGKVDIKRVDGSVARTCYYKIEGDRLMIDDGSGGECISPAVTPHVPMPRSFRKGT